jgi:hypothetical protein
MAFDLYEVLQISRNADEETIRRVYRIMAARFHPDNPKSGDNERFLELCRAYEVLSNAASRAQYDRTHIAPDAPLPIFELNDFTDGVIGEVNRRLGVLSLLYHRRRVCGDKPGISLLELEKLMGIPREYLDFTLWYLKSKEFVTPEQNSDYSVTSKGVDHLEAVSNHNALAKQLVSPQFSERIDEVEAEEIARAA